MEPSEVMTLVVSEWLYLASDPAPYRPQIRPKNTNCKDNLFCIRFDNFGFFMKLLKIQEFHAIPKELSNFMKLLILTSNFMK